jgi:hypothetical protein
VVIFTVLGRIHVYRFESVPMTLLVQLPGRSGDPTMWAANMPTGAAERAVHAVEILGEAGLSVRKRPISAGVRGEPCVDG